jgi:prephenate dehydrogenase
MIQDELDRLVFLLNKKKTDLKILKENEKKILSQIISYKDQIDLLEKQLRQEKWKNQEKSFKEKKREIILKAIEKRF